MFLPEKLSSEQDDVLAFWEKEDQEKRSKLIRLVGIAVALVIVAIVLIAFSSKSSRWEATRHTISEATGVEKIELSASALESFPNRESEVAKLVSNEFDQLESLLDEKLISMDKGSIQRLEQNLNRVAETLTESSRKSATDKWERAQELYGIANQGAGTLDEEAVSAVLNRLDQKEDVAFPKLAEAARGQLNRRIQSLESTSWEELKNQIKQAEGRQKIARAADAARTLNDQEDRDIRGREILELVTPIFEQFESLLDNEILDMNSEEKNSLLRNLIALKTLTDSQDGSVAKAETVFKNAQTLVNQSEEIGGMGLEAIKEVESEIQEARYSGFPGITQIVREQIDSRKKTLAEAETFPELENIVLPEGTELVWIPPGSFKMGTEPEDLKKMYTALETATEAYRARSPVNEAPLNKEIANGFWIGKYEITIREYLEFLNQKLGSNHHAWTDSESPHCPVEFQGGEWRMKKSKGGTWGDPDQPMVEVSWKGTIAFCDYLNERHKDKLPSGYEFSIPTEVEWEYAARAETSTPVPSGEPSFLGYYNSPEIGRVAWYLGNSVKDYTTRLSQPEQTQEKEVEYSSMGTQAKGTKLPNPWELYDTLGNASEWCYDVYQADPSTSVASSGEEDEDRVHRGGSIIHAPVDCRVARRDREPGDNFHFWLGFRIVLAPIRTN